MTARTAASTLRVTRPIATPINPIATIRPAVTNPTMLMNRTQGRVRSRLVMAVGEKTAGLVDSRGG
jgi:hypothetical protein